VRVDTSSCNTKFRTRVGHLTRTFGFVLHFKGPNSRSYDVSGYETYLRVDRTKRVLAHACSTNVLSSIEGAMSDPSVLTGGPDLFSV